MATGVFHNDEEKGVYMKRCLAVLVALFLALPALSFAGSATSRWDLSISGYVRFDMGYADQGVGADYTFPVRESGSKQNILDKYDNFFMASGHTRLGFRVKGPDAWTAKTSAYIEADFRGDASRLPTSYGIMALRQAWMQLDWADTSLRIGQDWQRWNLLGGFYVLGMMELTPFYKGVRQPQITLVQHLSKEFRVIAALAAPTNMFNSTDGHNVVNDYSRGFPHLQGELVYESDAWGQAADRKKLLFGVGGFYGNEKRTWQDSSTTYDDTHVTSWATTFRFGIPIIAQKSTVDRTGALWVGGTVGYGQNSFYMGGGFVGDYNRYGYNPNPRTSNVHFVSPIGFGGYGSIFYYWTDKLWSTFTYAQLQNQMSRPLRRNVATAGFVAPIYSTNYYINLIYDVNPSIQLGLQYAHLYAKWAGPGTGTSLGAGDRGELNTVRFAANYFF